MKFEVGEVVILVYIRKKNEIPGYSLYRPVPELVGHEVTIVGRDPADGEYEIERGSVSGWVSEPQLRKRRPPEEPAEQEFQQQLNQWLGRKEPQCS